MFQFRNSLITTIRLGSGKEVAVPANIIDVVRTDEETIARCRNVGSLRDVVFCWDNGVGLLSWTGQVRDTAQMPRVLPGKKALLNPLGNLIALEFPLKTYVELGPNEYVVAWLPDDDEQLNVACFGRDGVRRWTVGAAPKRIPFSYDGISLQPNGNLEGDVSARGYGSVIDPANGVVTSTYDCK